MIMVEHKGGGDNADADADGEKSKKVNQKNK